MWSNVPKQLNYSGYSVTEPEILGCGGDKVKHKIFLNITLEQS
jgi:hypothetical protein